MTAYINNPKEIEKRSFEIITEELGGKTFPPEIADIVKRVIHTTADFGTGRYPFNGGHGKGFG